MEVGSTIAKAFKRFTVPRSTSAIGSFTSSSANSANNAEASFEDAMPPPPPSSSSSSGSNHKHPPLSYVQNIRLIPQNNGADSRSHTSTPPLRENISSVMVRSVSTHEYVPKKSKTDLTSKSLTVPHDTSYDNLNEISLNTTTTDERAVKTNSHQRSSIKSLLTKKFHPGSVSNSVNIAAKPKKSRTAFRPFSQFLKRSHSTNSDLAVPSRQPPVELLEQRVQLKTAHEIESTNGTVTSPANTSLGPISEEEQLSAPKQHERVKTTLDESDPYTLNQSDSGISTYQKTTKPNNSLSASIASTPPSATSSNSNKQPHVNNQLQAREESYRPLKASISMMNPGQMLSVPSNNSKPHISPSISLESDVNRLSTSSANQTADRLAVHHTMSLQPGGDTNNENQQTNKVKMRDYSAKKKKGLRELKLRVSLPPEIKTSRSSYYPGDPPPPGALRDVLNKSEMSLTRLSPHTTGPLSRNEHRRSMLDMGFGKIESYVRLEKLGEGTYATVYKGTSNMVSGYVALKEIRLEQEEGAPCTALREVSLLKGLKHNNIVCLYDIIFDHTTLTLVFEYVDKDLKQYMEDCGTFMNMKNVRLFLFQLIRGLEFCHSKKILHRDLKPQNLLINERGELKLADFGLARVKSFPIKTYSHEVVTLWYRPPDVLLGSTEYSTPIDVWAVGCIFYEMACGRPLFPGTKVEEELYLIFKYLGTPTEQTLPGVTSKAEFRALKLPFYFGDSFTRLAPRLDASGIDLLQKFLRYDPPSRISAYDALRHSFFSCYPAEIYSLPPEKSVLDLTEVALTKDHGSKYNASSLMKTAIGKRSSVHL